MQWFTSEFNDKFLYPSHDPYNFFKKFFKLGLFQINHAQNRNHKILDVVFTNVLADFKIEESYIALCFKAEDKDHNNINVKHDYIKHENMKERRMLMSEMLPKLDLTYSVIDNEKYKNENWINREGYEKILPYLRNIVESGNYLEIESLRLDVPKRYANVPVSVKGEIFSPIYQTNNNSPILYLNETTLVKPSVFLLDNYLASQIRNCLHEKIPIDREEAALENLKQYYTFLKEQLARGTQVDVIYINLSKSLDRIDKALLISILRETKCIGKFVNIINSFLNARGENVTEDETYTSIPKGTDLGHFLVRLFLSDVKQRLKNCEILIHNEQIKIFKGINSDTDYNTLQENFEAVLTWCKTSRIQIDMNKCSVISFIGQGKCYPNLYSYKFFEHKIKRNFLINDLGVVFDPSFKFNSHFMKLYFMIVCIEESSLLSYTQKFISTFDDDELVASSLVRFTQELLHTAYISRDSALAVCTT